MVSVSCHELLLCIFHMYSLSLPFPHSSTHVHKAKVEIASCGGQPDVCAQDITVNGCENIVFDTALQFVGDGFCHLKPSINVLVLRKDGKEVFRCKNVSSCDPDNNFIMNNDFGNITKLDATVEDGGMYELGVSVGDPNSYVRQKTFNVMIRGNYMDVW